MKRFYSVLALLILCGCVTDRGEKPASYANLNHFYLVVDPETANAIATLPLLETMVGRRVDDPDEPGQTYAGTYLYGQQTYAEFFSPRGYDLTVEDPAPVGLFGIAVGGDRVGDLDQVAAAMDSRAIPYDRSLRTFTTRDGEELGRFEKINLKGASDRHNMVWVMQYHAELFALIRETSDDASIQTMSSDSVSREVYNVGRYEPGLQIRDIARLKLAITPSEEQPFIDILGAAGFVITTTPNGFFALGNDVELEFAVVKDGSVGVSEIEFALHRAPCEAKSIPIGSSQLAIGPGAVATWRFDGRD
ncbi:MAG: DUF5829 family protein [Pseudomonadota bacterium]